MKSKGGPSQFPWLAKATTGSPTESRLFADDGGIRVTVDDLKFSKYSLLISEVLLDVVNIVLNVAVDFHIYQINSTCVTRINDNVPSSFCLFNSFK